MITADQIVAHAVGDYILQSDWMATEKTKRTVAALAHVAAYSLPFLLLTRSPAALAFIVVTHFLIDRWRLARYVVWAKNYLGPGNRPWAEVKDSFGYPKDRPPWLTMWLLIIADNTMHLLCNGAAIRWLS